MDTRMELLLREALRNNYRSSQSHWSLPLWLVHQTVSRRTRTARYVHACFRKCLSTIVHACVLFHRSAASVRKITVIASYSKMGRSSLLALFLWTLCLVRGQSPTTSVPVPECPTGFEFQECGTACPQTCADVQRPSPRPCTLQCVRGEEYIVMQ